MKKSWIAVPAIALAGLVADAKEAEATEGLYQYPASSYSGSTCQVGSESYQDWVRNGGVGENLGALSTNVVCPITRRNPSSELGINYATMDVYNVSGTLTCALYHETHGGFIRKTVSTSTTSTGAVTLHFGGVSPIMGVESQGSYYIGCYLPSHASIDSYYIVEKY